MKARRALISAATVLLLGGGGYFGGRYYLNSISPRETFTATDGTRVWVEELSFFKGKDAIYGKVYKPQDTLGRKPVLIWCHGLGQSGDESDQICRMAAGLGYVAYTFDFRGGSESSRSGGSMKEMSLRSEQKDLETVVSRLSKLSFADKNRIYLAGHSLGAAVAAVELGDHPKDYEGGILLAPALNLPEVARMYYPDAEKIPSETELLGYTLGRRFFSDIHSLDPYAKLRKFKGNVLIIQGDSDDIVQPRFAEQVASAFPKAELVMMEGVGHTFNGTAGDNMRGALSKYLSSENPAGAQQ